MARASPDLNPAFAFDPRPHAQRASVLRDRNAEHLVLGDGISIVLEQGSFLSEPVNLIFPIRDDANASTQLQSLARFRAFRRSGQFKPAHPGPHAQHWVNQLRAYDAVAQGASERDIAGVLFARRLASEGWRTGGESVRSAVRRLIAPSRRMVAGDYRKLLC